MSTQPEVSSSLDLSAISGDYANRQFSSLLDLSFGVPTNMCFLEDFPVWDPNLKVPDVMRWGAFQGDQLLSSTAIRRAQIRLHSSRLIDIAILGAVSTRPEWRGHGLASRLVAHAVGWAEKQNVSAILLWGAESSFYHRLGFVNFGKQMRLPLSVFENRRERSSSIQTGWNPKIFSLLQNRAEGLVLSSSDLKWYSAHRNVEWFWSSDRNGQLKAYAALGRGIDLGNIVHEWGGSKKELEALLASISTQRPNATLLCSLQHAAEFGILAEKNLTPIVDSLGMIRVLDPLLTLESFEKLWVWGLDAA
jgi:hypothetical protein